MSPENLDINSGGFLFDHYGVRVPAVIVSPFIPQGSVDHTLYDHASVLATLEHLYGLPALTNRDATANYIDERLLSLPSPRTDCPTTLSSPAAAVAEAKAADTMQDDVREQPLPDAGNMHGFLAIMLKTDLELARGDEAETAAIQDKFKQITTRGDAQTYAEEVLSKAKVAQANRTTAPALLPRDNK